jgi:hypothetical protein
MLAAGVCIRRPEKSLRRAIGRAPIGDAASLFAGQRYRRSSASAVEPPRRHGIRQIHDLAGIVLLAREPKRSCGVELIGPGRQTVLPPMPHPDTGQPYVWLGEEALEEVKPQELPALDLGVVQRLTEKLALFVCYC